MLLWPEGATARLAEVQRAAVALPGLCAVALMHRSPAARPKFMASTVSLSATAAALKPFAVRPRPEKPATQARHMSQEHLSDSSDQSSLISVLTG